MCEEGSGSHTRPCVGACWSKARSERLIRAIQDGENEQTLSDGQTVAWELNLTTQMEGNENGYNHKPTENACLIERLKLRTYRAFDAHSRTRALECAFSPRCSHFTSWEGLPLLFLFFPFISSCPPPTGGRVLV